MFHIHIDNAGGSRAPYEVLYTVYSKSFMQVVHYEKPY